MTPTINKPVIQIPEVALFDIKQHHIKELKRRELGFLVWDNDRSPLLYKVASVWEFLLNNILRANPHLPTPRQEYNLILLGVNLNEDLLHSALAENLDTTVNALDLPRGYLGELVVDTYRYHLMFDGMELSFDRFIPPDGVWVGDAEFAFTGNLRTVK